jgi:5-dehydro-2-deoxygluconokinase
MKTPDVITIGRTGVDLYGAQIGGRLEDMGSFNKYIGGSPTNIGRGAENSGIYAKGERRRLGVLSFQSSM